MFQRKKILIKSVYALLDSAVVNLLGLLTVIYFARVLPKAEFGVLTIALCVNILGITFCDLSVGQALIHYGTGDNKRNLSKTLFNSIVLKILCFILIVFSISIFAYIISTFFNNALLAKVLMLVLVLIFFTFFYNSCLQTLNVKEKIHKMFYTDLIWLLTLICGVYLVHSYDLISNASSAIIFLILIRCAALFFAVIFVSNEVCVKSFFRLDKTLLKKLSLYARYSFTNSLGVFIFSKTDIFMLGFMLNNTYVAFYASALVVTNIFKFLNEPATLIVLPMISKLHHQKTANLNKIIRRVFLTTGLTSLSVSIPIAVFLLVFPEYFLHLLYGPKYTECTALVRLFAIWGLILPFYRCSATIFNGIGFPQINARYTWFGGIFNVILNLPLIYYFRANGAATASIATSIALLLLFLHTLKKRFHIFKPASCVLSTSLKAEM